MRKLTSDERKKIAMYIKNKIDISELIKNVDISNENFSNAVIKDLSIVNQVLKNVNFSNAFIGNDKKVTLISGNTLINCNFKGTVFLYAIHVLSKNRV